MRRALRLQADYNELLTQITQLAGDASFNGVNLLDSDNLDRHLQRRRLELADDRTASTSPRPASASARPPATASRSTPTSTRRSTQLDAATTTLRTQASAFGSNLSIVQARQDFTKNMINVLQIGADNLDARRHQRRRREHAGPADPPAALDCRSVARRAGRPERAAVVLIETTSIRRQTAGPWPRRFSFWDCGKYEAKRTTASLACIDREITDGNQHVSR